MRSTNPSRDASRVELPPAVSCHEQEKFRNAWPTAQKFIQDHSLNELFSDGVQDFGIILQGGMYNTTVRAARTFRTFGCFRDSKMPLYVLNVTYPFETRR